MLLAQRDAVHEFTYLRCDFSSSPCVFSAMILRTCAFLAWNILVKVSARQFLVIDLDFVSERTIKDHHHQWYLLVVIIA